MSSFDFCLYHNDHKNQCIRKYAYQFDISNYCLTMCVLYFEANGCSTEVSKISFDCLKTLLRIIPGSRYIA